LLLHPLDSFLFLFLCADATGSFLFSCSIINAHAM
jgi:hypothetical protein